MLSNTMWGASMANIKYLPNLAIAIDQLFNALRGGSHKETISAAAWRMGDIRNEPRWHRFRLFIDAIFFWQKKVEGRGHCQQSFDNEKARKYQAKEYHTPDEPE